MKYLIAASAALILVFAGTSFAQSPDDDEHGMGLLPESIEQISEFPKTATHRAFLPSWTDLSSSFPRPGDQGRQGSCVGWAVGYAARSYYAQTAEGRSVRDASNIPSPAYIYNSVLENPGNCQEGTNISKALRFLKDGSLSLQEYPYDSTSCSRPSESMKQRASDFKAGGFSFVDPKRPDQIKAELARGDPVIFGMKLTREFSSLRGDRIYRGGGEYRGGSHAMTIVGYDDVRQAFKVINSWGTRWGNGGFGWISYDTIIRDAEAAFVIQGLPKPVNPAPEPTPAPPQRPPLISKSECGEVKVVRESGRDAIVGFVGTNDQLERIRKNNPTSELRVTVRPWPQCEALTTVAKHLDRADTPKVKIIGSSDGGLASGERLAFEVETPSFPSYLHVAYFQADGSVVNLVQPGVGEFRVYPPSTKLLIGGGTDNRIFRVSPPFGQEMLIVLAGRAPVFNDRLPAIETEREFLTALRRALIAKPDPQQQEREVTANFDTVVTFTRKNP